MPYPVRLARAILSRWIMGCTIKARKVISEAVKVAEQKVRQVRGVVGYQYIL